MELDLQGWFHPEEGKWYCEQVRKLVGGWIVEVGCWKGLSTSYLAPELVGKPQRLWCVDNWLGSKDQYADFYQTLLKRQDEEGRPVHIQFRDNLHYLKIPHKILQMDSKDASKYFKNKSCSLVFIDASHDYSSVKEDLTIWWPKVRVGGILSGHNYSTKHPDLIKAVKEFSFSNKLEIKRGPVTIFYFSKH
ncbi:MAG: class I SAM-dependent methyltransferase [Candidatus Helarchaeota archaeon]